VKVFSGVKVFGPESGRMRRTAARRTGPGETKAPSGG
jgi:hypothetical protein